MKPQKKSKLKYVIYAVLLAAALLVAANLACAGAEAGLSGATAETAVERFSATYEIFMQRMSDGFLNLYRCDNTGRFLLYASGIWLVAVLAVENRNRNYIRGKEYGTARWGTQADIKDLFAENLCKREVRKAKQVRSRIGRRIARRKAYAGCERDGKLLKASKMDMLAEAESAAKAAGTYSKSGHNEEVKRINREVVESVENAKKDAWEPDRIEADFRELADEIDHDFLLSPAEREVRVKLAGAERDKRLKMFYSSSGRIEKIRLKYQNADMPLTKTERISIYNHVLNNNTLILGGSGSGKTRGYVMPNILQAHSSYIITDPKGEILEKAGYFLSEIKGYKLRVLNLDNKSLSDYYNPFYYLHPDRAGYEERVLSLIETIIVNTDDGERKTSSDPFWDKAERLFLQAIFFFVSDGFIPEDRNMNTVMQLIRMLKIEEDGDDFNSDLDIFARIFARRFGEDHIGVQQYEEFRQKASGKTAKSIVITAVSRLAPFRTKEVRRIFSSDNMRLDRVGEERTAVFVVVPPTDPAFNFVAGMLFTQLFQELQYCASEVHKHDGQRLPVPCRFILDEFANTCKIPNFVKILAYARSFGIGITPILQSLEQIKNMYKDEWGVIIDNCNSLLFLGSITHMDTLEYMSKLLGKATYDKKTSGHSYGMRGSSSENFDVIGRELMKEDEIRKMDKSDCLLVIGGRPPFYSKKYRYETHPNYRYTSDGNPAYSFAYTPQPVGKAEGEKPEPGDVKPEREDPESLPDYAEVVPDRETIRVLAGHFDDMEMIDNDIAGAGMTPEEADELFEMDEEDGVPIPEDENLSAVRTQARNLNLEDLPGGGDEAEIVYDEETLEKLVNDFDSVEIIGDDIAGAEPMEEELIENDYGDV